MPSHSNNLIHHKQISNYYPNHAEKNKRKEKDLHLALPLKPHGQYVHRERASASASGSITVEASLALPLFFLAIVSVTCLLEIMAVQAAVRAGLHYAGKVQAETMYVPKLSTSTDINNNIIESVGSDRLDRSIIEGGRSGLDTGDSYIEGATGLINASVRYEIRLPIPIFAVPNIRCREQITVKGWCGYVPAGGFTKEEETVYVTETGLVYHTDYHCTYLDLSIRMVPVADIPNLRNTSQGKYYPCEKCGKGASHAGVFITNTGDRYHTDIGCSGIKRMVYTVLLSEVNGKGACSRCGR